MTNSHGFARCPEPFEKVETEKIETNWFLGARTWLKRVELVVVAQHDQCDQELGRSREDRPLHVRDEDMLHHRKERHCL